MGDLAKGPNADALGSSPLVPTAVRDLVVIDVAHQGSLQEKSVPVVWKGASLILAELTVDQQIALSPDVPFDVIAYDMKDDRPTSSSFTKVKSRRQSCLQRSSTEKDSRWLSR